MKKILENDNLDQIPHYVTINELLKELKNEYLETVRKKMIKELNGDI